MTTHTDATLIDLRAQAPRALGEGAAVLSKKTTINNWAVVAHVHVPKHAHATGPVHIAIKVTANDEQDAMTALAQLLARLGTSEPALDDVLEEAVLVFGPDTYVDGNDGSDTIDGCVVVSTRAGRTRIDDTYPLKRVIEVPTIASAYAAVRAMHKRST